MRILLLILLAAALVGCPLPPLETGGTGASSVYGGGDVFEPQSGVRCDRRQEICYANGRASRGLTRTYFGDAAAERIDGDGFAERPPGLDYDRPSYNRPYERPDYSRPDYDRPDYDRPGYGRPGYNRPGSDRPAYTGETCTAYSDDDFRGARFAVEANRRYPELGGFNNRIASLSVPRNCELTAYENTGLRGDRTRFPEGDYRALDNRWSGRISSLECRCF